MIYEPNWETLKTHSTPKWFQNAKFGIYTHWGIYSVPACGPNGSWYGNKMYKKGTPQYKYHLKNYGDPSEFGYKDFIPLFQGEKFDPEEWAKLFKKAGAQFAGPVGEHHDGFSLWDSDVTKWNAKNMGPECDVVGKLERAIKKRNMKFMVALHHSFNWWFFPHWEEDYDTSNPENEGLYGPMHDQDWEGKLPENKKQSWLKMEKPNQKFLERWIHKNKEVVNNYKPDLLWFDFGLEFIQEKYKKRFLSYYYNKEKEWDKEVVVTYKWHHLAPGSGVVDLELGKFDQLTYNEWLTDTTIDDGTGWSYIKDAEYKSTRTLIHYLIDNISKNGYMLLNVGPKSNGKIPPPARKRLLEIGEWLNINGEAVYNTTPWMVYGEGPTKMKKAGAKIEDQKIQFTSEDIRFTVKENILYAFVLGWPENEEILIKTIPEKMYKNEISSIKMLGIKKELKWKMDNSGLKVKLPSPKPCNHAYVLKINRQNPF